jgi:hypothetical protein
MVDSTTHTPGTAPSAQAQMNISSRQYGTTVKSALEDLKKLSKEPADVTKTPAFHEAVAVHAQTLTSLVNQARELELAVLADKKANVPVDADTKAALKLAHDDIAKMTTGVNDFNKSQVKVHSDVRLKMSGTGTTTTIKATITNSQGTKEVNPTQAKSAASAAAQESADMLKTEAAAVKALGNAVVPEGNKTDPKYKWIKQGIEKTLSDLTGSGASKVAHDAMMSNAYQAHSAAQQAATSASLMKMVTDNIKHAKEASTTANPDGTAQSKGNHNAKGKTAATVGNKGAGGSAKAAGGSAKASGGSQSAASSTKAQNGSSQMATSAKAQGGSGNAAAGSNKAQGGSSHSATQTKLQAASASAGQNAGAIKSIQSAKGAAATKASSAAPAKGSAAGAAKTAGAAPSSGSTGSKAGSTAAGSTTAGSAANDSLTAAVDAAGGGMVSPGGDVGSGLGAYAGFPNINGLLMAVLLECYKSGQKGLLDMTTRLQAQNKAKDGVRAQLTTSQASDSANSKAHPNDSTAQGASAGTDALQNKLSSMGDDASMTQLQLQNSAQNQSMLLQMISDFSKSNASNSLSIIRNIVSS